MTSAAGAAGSGVGGAVAAAAARLTGYAQALCAQTPVPGGAWAVVDRDGVVASGCWGLADLAAGTPVRPEHRFEIGSISKVVTAVVIHQLVDEGLVDLDRPVTEVVPWLDLGTPAAAITARHLLSHTAGLVLGADHLPDEPAQVWALRGLTRSGMPGERFHYSNLGFMVLGVLARQVTGRPWPALVEERVLRPLGATGAAGAARTGQRHRMATGHWPLHDDRPFVPGDPVVAAPWFEVDSADGNVVATAGDLARLARFLLGDGELDGVRLLTPGSMAALVSPAAPSGDGVPVWGDSPASQQARYGLGINVEQVDGRTCVTHGGGMVGYACYLLADRDSGLGAVVLTNGTGDHPASHPIAYVGHRLFRAALDGRPVPQPPDASAVVRPGELDPGLLGEFTGRAPGGGSLRLVVAAGPDGTVEVRTGAGRGRLFRTWSSRLATDHPDLRAFPLTAADDGWLAGPWVFRPPAPGQAQDRAPARPDAPPDAMPDPRLAPYVGRYRSWSPWFPSFRIVARGAGLVLVAAGGVEAPLEDADLVGLGGGVFRIGADPWLPERLVVGPVVDGRCLTVVRDGCAYSRASDDDLTRPPDPTP